MKFWDSSAIVPLVSDEEKSAWARKQLRTDPVGIVWCLSSVEVQSALARRLREGALSRKDHDAAERRSRALFRSMSRVVAIEPVLQRALRIVNVHPLRAADSLQLAAALVVSRDRPADLTFATLDVRLAEVARSEGFPVEIDWGT